MAIERNIRSSAEKPIFTDDEVSSVWPFDRERSLIFGRGYRLLLEVSNPSVAKVISKYAEFSFSRLQKTILGNNEIIFGTPSEALSRAKIVNNSHHKSEADDVRLKLFVLRMRTFGVITTFENFVREMDPLEKDNYVKGIKKYGLLLGVADKYSPNNFGELMSDIRHDIHIGQIKIDEDAQQILSKVLNPFVLESDILKYARGNVLVREACRYIFPYMNQMNSIVTKVLLNKHFRDIYALTPSKNEQKLFDVFTWMIKSILPRMPDGIRFHKEYNRWQKSSQEI